MGLVRFYHDGEVPLAETTAGSNDRLSGADGRESLATPDVRGSSRKLGVQSPVKSADNPFNGEPVAVRGFICLSRSSFEERGIRLVPASEIMTADEVAAFLKVSRATVYKLMKSKKLPGFRLAGEFRFRRSDIDAWMRRPLKKP